jgi:peroxiredoxin Q/BCP
VRNGITVAGVSRDSLESHQRWVKRLHLPYALLSDPGGEATRRLGLEHRIGIAGWSIELVRRTTMLIDARGIVDTIWGRVKVRGHAAAVLARAREMRVSEPEAHPGDAAPEEQSG